MALADEIVALLESAPDMRWTAKEIRREFPRSTSNHIHNSLAALVKQDRVWKRKRGVYQASGRKRKANGDGWLEGDCERVRRTKRFQEYAAGRKRRPRCCKTCHRGDGQHGAGPGGTGKERRGFAAGPPPPRGGQ